MKVGGLEIVDEAVEGTPRGGVGPADGGEQFAGGGDAGGGGEEVGGAMAVGDVAGVGKVGEERGEEVEGVGRGGGVDEVEDAKHEGDYNGKWGECLGTRTDGFESVGVLFWEERMQCVFAGT